MIVKPRCIENKRRKIQKRQSVALETFYERRRETLDETRISSEKEERGAFEV